MKRKEDLPLNCFVPTSLVLKHVILAHKHEMAENRNLRFELLELQKRNKALGKTIETLEKTICTLKDNHKEWTREIHAEDLYKNQQVRMAQMKADREKLRIRRDDLIALCNKYEKILREHHLMPER